jgi:multidrug efflux pump
VNRALDVRWLVVGLGVSAAVVSGILFVSLKSELAPAEDRGVLLVRGTGPEGATLAYTSRYSSEVDAIYATIPEVNSRLVINGMPEVSRFLAIGRLSDWSERERKQQQLTDIIRPEIRDIVGVQAFASSPAAFGKRGGSRPVEFVIQSSGTYEQLQDYADKMLERIRENPGLEGVDTDLKLNTPEFRIEINRAKVADLGLDVAVVGRTLETLLGGRRVTRFEQDGEQYDVYVQLAASDRNSPGTLSTIFVRGASGAMVQLSNIVTITEAVAPKELKRFNQLRSVMIQANLAPGYSLGEALTFLERTAREVLPASVQTDLSGQSREFKSAGQSLVFVFVLALGFIYLVLSAQFESFRDPIIILFAVPLSMAGALGALYLTGGTLNVYSQIGLVTLVGLISKHGIMIVDFANQRQDAGLEPRAAIIEAAALRLRPILMTTGAMVLGAVPLALATGAGAESRQQIGWVIAGGMSLGTLLTLFVVPVAYSLIGRKQAAMIEEGSHAAVPAE